MFLNVMMQRKYKSRKMAPTNKLNKYTVLTARTNFILSWGTMLLFINFSKELLTTLCRNSIRRRRTYYSADVRNTMLHYFCNKPVVIFNIISTLWLHYKRHEDINASFNWHGKNLQQITVMNSLSS